jgi:hypothetical protein
MTTIPKPGQQAIETLLTNAALMCDITDEQRTNAVKVARAAGWTLQDIGKLIGRSHPAVRSIALREDQEGAA